MSIISELLLPSVLLKTLRKYQKRYPRQFAIFSVLFLVTYIGFFYFIYQQDQKNKEIERAKSLSFENQLNNLKQAETNLNNLIAFVEDQRIRLQQSEDLLNNLKAEKQKLEPLVNADKDVVKAIVDAQEEIQGRNQWIGYVASFILGVLSSIVGSVILNSIKTLRNKQQVAA